MLGSITGRVLPPGDTLRQIISWSSSLSVFDKFSQQISSLGMTLGVFFVLVVAGLLFWRFHKGLAKRTLMASSEDFRDLFEQTPVGILVNDMQGRVLEANPKACEIFGYSYAEFIGLNIKDLVTRDEQAKDPIQLDLIQSHQPVMRTPQVTRKNGEIIKIEIHARRQLNGNIQTFLLDITDRSRLEAQIREAEERYRLIVNTLPAIIYTHSINGAQPYFFISPYVENALGFTVEELGQNTSRWEEIFHPEDRERVMAANKRSIEERAQHQSDYRLIAKDGQIHWFRVEAVPLTDEQNNVVGLMGLALDITGRKAAEEALHREQMLNKLILENLPLGVVLLDKDMTIRKCNRAYEEFIQKHTTFGGRTAVGQPYLRVKDDTSENLEQVLLSVVEHGHVIRNSGVELISNQPDKQVTSYWDTFTLPVLDQANKVEGIIRLLIDVTERVTQANIQKDIKGHFWRIAQSTHEIIWDWDFTTGQVWRNSSVNDRPMFGYMASEIVGNPQWWFDRIHPEDLERVLTSQLAAISDGTETWENEFRFCKKDGTYAWVFEKGYISRAENGEVLRMYGGTIDITGRKQGEYALSKSEALFRTTFEKAGMGIALFDLQGRVIRTNPAYQELLGYSGGELKGLHFGDFTHPEDLEEDLKNGQALLAGEFEKYQMEKRYIRKDGQSVWVCLTGTLVKDEHGQPEFLVGMVEDIDEKKRAAEQLRLQNHRTYLLSELGRELAKAGLEYNTVFNVVAHQIAQTISDICVVGWVRKERQTLQIVALAHQDPEVEHVLQSIPFDDEYPIAGTPTSVILQTNKSNLVADIPQILQAFIPPPYLSLLEQRGISHWLITPVMAQQSLDVVLILVRESLDNPFTDQDKQFIETLASRAALVVENAHLYQQVEQRASELSTLYATSLELARQHDLPALLQMMVVSAIQLLNGDAGVVGLIDPALREVRCMVSERTYANYTGQVRKFGEGGPGTIAETGLPLLIENYAQWDKRDFLPIEEQPKSMMGVPMVWHGQVNGTLLIYNYTDQRTFSQADLELLTLFANQAAIAIENANLLQTQRQKTAQLLHSNSLIESLNLIATDIQASLDPHDAMRLLAEGLNTLAITSAVSWYHPALEALEIKHISLDAQKQGELQTQLGISLPGFRIPLQSLAQFAHVVQKGEPIFVERPIQEYRDIFTALGWSNVEQSIILLELNPEINAAHLPLIVGQDVTGIVHLWGEGIKAEDLPALSIFANQVAASIENARLFEKTARQRKQLHVLSVRLREIEETEKRRLAQELHDRVGQVLTAVGININLIKNVLAAGKLDRVERILTDSSCLVDDAISQIRDVTAELRPPVLDDYGLISALIWYGQRFNERTGILVEITPHNNEPERFSPDLEVVFFRIAQEALTNVAKHARATQVVITLDRIPQGNNQELIRLTIADNGIGFEPDKERPTTAEPSWGLVTMRERAGAVGGSLKISSSPGNGARVSIEVESEGLSIVD